MKIFDIHSHFGPTSSGEDTSVHEMQCTLQSFGISKVGISCLSGNSMSMQNDLIYRAMQASPDFIEGYAFINPKAPDAVEEVEKCLSVYKMNGIKLHSWKHGYYPDNRPELHAIFDEIKKYDVHVQTHVGTAPLSTPYIWAEWARRYPEIDFVFTHTGYYEFGYSTIEAVKNLSNVKVETSGQMDVGVLKAAINILGPKRMVFGTDWPYKPVNIEIEKFSHFNLKDNELEDIFYRNAASLWREKI
ncbi:MAG: amidohydrolase family protein [Eubacteriales bacterium]|nr:amidohydrolase family protein [Eubacteriales bacterium]